MDEQELKQTLLRIEEQQKLISESVSRLNSDTAPMFRDNSGRQSGKRDIWDKIGAISPILSGLFIATGAMMATYSFNQQQIKLQEAQTIEKFIPHLMGNDASKRMAILCLRTLVNTDIAAKCAAMFPSAGTVSALKTIAKTGDSHEQQVASQALNKTMSELNAQKQSDVPGSPEALQDSRELKNAMETFQFDEPGRPQPEAAHKVESGQRPGGDLPVADNVLESKEAKSSENAKTDSGRRSERADSRERTDVKERNETKERLKMPGHEERSDAGERHGKNQSITQEHPNLDAQPIKEAETL